MKEAYYLLITLAFAVFISCSDKGDEPTIYCDSPAVPVFRLKWEDSMGRDLLFSDSARLSLKDVSFKADYNGQVFNSEQMHLMVDSVSSDTTFLLMSFMGNGVLSLGDLPPDTLAFTFEKTNDQPCAGSSLAKLEVNHRTYCEPCFFRDPIILRK